MVLPDTGTDASIALARRIQQRMSRSPLPCGDQHIALTVSIGVGTMRAADVGAYQSLSRADKAMYRAKELGRDRIELDGD